MELPVELKYPKKWLINIKNEDQKCFLWWYLRHINPVEIHPERITNEDKNLVNDLDFHGIEFHVQEKDLSKIEKRNNIGINVFGYENGQVFSNFRFRRKIWKLDVFVACI